MAERTRRRHFASTTPKLIGVSQAGVVGDGAGPRRKIAVEKQVTEMVTIPAHIEDGSLRLDAPLPSHVIKVEVRVQVAGPIRARRSVAAYLESLPPGNRSGEEIDRDLREERNSWPD